MIAEELGCQNAQGVQRASAKNGRRRGTLPDLRRPDEIICTIPGDPRSCIWRELAPARRNSIIGGGARVTEKSQSIL